jgi:hypothetical protein
MTDPDDPMTGDGVDAVGSSPVARSRVARRREAQRPVAGRAAAIVTVVAVIAGIGIASATIGLPPAPPSASTGDGVPVAPADAQVSTLFCTSGAGVDAGAGATEVVVLANSTHSAARGVMTAVPASGTTLVRTPLSVPARGTADVIPATGLPVGATASTFTFTGGGVTGTMVIGGPTGWSTAPCASTVSAQWEFAGGSTNTGLLDLSLYDPTAASAVVDVSFLTANGGLLQPQAYQGIMLTPGQLVVAGLAAYVQNQPVVATMVQASSGAVVATELDRLAVPSGSGLALVAGTPALATTWRFAQTTALQGGNVSLVVANPGMAPVAAVVRVGLSGATVTPRVLDVPARSVATLAVSGVAGWPLGSPYSLTVTAPTPIIVGRSVSAPSGSASPQAGLTGGTTTTARSWLVVGPGSPGNALSAGAAIRSLAVADPGSAPIQVTVVPLGGGRPLAMARAQPHGLVVFGAAAVGGLQPLVVTASGPAVVEAEYGPTGAPGVISTAGFPLAS